jgi:hypothetical protein
VRAFQRKTLQRTMNLALTGWVAERSKAAVLKFKGAVLVQYPQNPNNTVFYDTFPMYAAFTCTVYNCVKMGVAGVSDTRCTPTEQA